MKRVFKKQEEGGIQTCLPSMCPSVRLSVSPITKNAPQMSHTFMRFSCWVIDLASPPLYRMSGASFQIMLAHTKRNSIIIP